jgi:PIN domain nuclease of toxin-antitoxin system
VSSVVLDASALLVLLYAEEGKDEVAATVRGAAMSAVNLAEVVGKLADRGGTEGGLRDVVSRVGLEVHPFELDDAFAVGSLRERTRGVGLSLGDRACLALGMRLDRPVLTADRAWTSLKLGVTVRLVR